MPVHGFVLAGGKSSRMGRDKARLPFRGRPMVEIAVEKLRSFCAEVSVAGNREDLQEFAPVVFEARTDVGPGAGIEAGLLACVEPWAMFLPVDVPLVPASLLRRWAEAVIGEGPAASLLLTDGERQPAFCMVRRTAGAAVSEALDGGERRLDGLLYAVERSGLGAVWAVEAGLFADGVGALFRNVNTPEELEAAEAWAEGGQVAFGSET